VAADRARVLIVGGGYIGTYAALGLQRRLRRGEAQLTLVSPESYMTYQSFLPEAASGNIEPRHVVVPLRRVLKHTRVLTGRVTGIDTERRRATVAPIEGEPFQEPYDVLIVGAGSVSRILPVPGLAERAVGFKTVEEAIYLRNEILERMDAAETTDDPAIRRRALTFVFVGGGYAGIEALGELEDLATEACRYYRTVRREDMRWVLVEAADGILPELGPKLGDHALERLRRRGVEVHLGTRLESADGGVMRLSNGESFPADTLVWTTGVRAEPIVAEAGLPVDDRGRLPTDEFLRVRGADGVWAGGDCAAVPDLVTGGICPPTAQHALRQAKRLARNVAAELRGEYPKPFRYRQLGYLVSLGRHQGVAVVLGLRLRGFPAWFAHRTYHVFRHPTVNRKVRVMSDWTLALFFRRDIVQLGSLRRPRAAFRQPGDLPNPEKPPITGRSSRPGVEERGPEE
jgi:NADH:ubiquinone reductase (H+-translocating)